VLVLLLARLGVTLAFAAGAGPRAAAVGEALGRRAQAMGRAQTAHGAVTMAAAAAELAGAPAVAVLDGEDAVQAGLGAMAQARRDGCPLVVLGPPPGAADACLPGLIEVTSLAEAVRTLHAPVRRPVFIGCDGAEPPDAEPALAASPDVARHPAPDPACLDEAARRLAAGTRPVVVVGRHARSPEDAQWVRAFAEALPAPVVTAAKARGVMPEPHPLALGELGGEVAAAALERADVVIALGVDAADVGPSPWRWAAPVIEIAPVTMTAAPWTAAVQVPAAAALVLEELAPRVNAAPRADWDMTELDALKRRLVAVREAVAPGGGDARAAAVVGRVREATPRGTIAVFEPRWRAAAASWQCTAPGELLVPAAPGLRGSAVAAALAVRRMAPARGVVAFTDAPGLAESMAELAHPGPGFAVVVLDGLPATLFAGVRALGCLAIAAPDPGLAAEQAARAAHGARPLVVAAS
jgi:acetolactate synthase I/II/III large subunit